MLGSAAAEGTGLEPATRKRAPDFESGADCVKPEENDTFSNSAAVGAAVGRENTAVDPDLATIIERWTDLPEPLKAGMVAMVRAAGGK